MNEEEAAVVCPVPVIKKGYEDKIIWGPTSSGIVTVNSAYYLTVNTKRNLTRIIKQQNFYWMEQNLGNENSKSC